MSDADLVMLDTNICSFIMRERPLAVLQHLEQTVESGAQVCVSAVTYAEMMRGATSRKASLKHLVMVNGLVARLNSILPWDAAAIDEAVALRNHLFAQGTPIGENDLYIAGHALSLNALLVTNNTREFSRVPGLRLADWTRPER